MPGHGPWHGPMHHAYLNLPLDEVCISLMNVPFTVRLLPSKCCENELVEDMRVRSLPRLKAFEEAPNERCMKLKNKRLVIN
jgi:hypothetical protein